MIQLPPLNIILDNAGAPRYRCIKALRPYAKTADPWTAKYKDLRKSFVGWHHCAGCLNRLVAGQPLAFIHLVVFSKDFPRIVHPSCEPYVAVSKLYNDVGFWRVCPACADKLGSDWVHQPEAIEKRGPSNRQRLLYALKSPAPNLGGRTP